MKALIKKWLGVPDKSEYIKYSDVKNLVERAVYEALQPNLPTGYKKTFWCTGPGRNIRGTLERCVFTIVDKRAREVVDLRVREVVQPEDFIDGVVQRIKKKQLTVGKGYE